MDAEVSRIFCRVVAKNENLKDFFKDRLTNGARFEDFRVFEMLSTYLEKPAFAIALKDNGQEAYPMLFTLVAASKLTDYALEVDDTFNRVRMEITRGEGEETLSRFVDELPKFRIRMLLSLYIEEQLLVEKELVIDNKSKASSDCEADWILKATKWSAQIAMVNSKLFVKRLVESKGKRHE